MVEYYRLPPTVLMPSSVTEANRHNMVHFKGAPLVDSTSFMFWQQKKPGPHIV
jgi:hypothetical protein